MILCAAGDIHGALDQLYADVLALEQALAVRFDWVLHVGDFGVWPDPARVDAATLSGDKRSCRLTPPAARSVRAWASAARRGRCCSAAWTSSTSWCRRAPPAMRPAPPAARASD